jgi:homoserine dehydrogenase
VVRAGVGPALVPLESPLARVRGSENIVTLQGRFGGETTFGGRGAGGEPTAVAVVSDLLAIAKDEVPLAARVSVAHAEVSPDFTSAYYVRFTVADRPGIIASLASAFARHSINIDAILQEPGFPIGRRPFVVSLEPSPVSSIERAMNDLSTFEFHGEAPVALPVLSAVSTGVLA